MRLIHIHTSINKGLLSSLLIFFFQLVQILLPDQVIDVFFVLLFLFEHIFLIFLLIISHFVQKSLLLFFCLISVSNFFTLFSINLSLNVIQEKSLSLLFQCSLSFILILILVVLSHSSIIVRIESSLSFVSFSLLNISDLIFQIVFVVVYFGLSSHLLFIIVENIIWSISILFLLSLLLLSPHQFFLFYLIFQRIDKILFFLIISIQFLQQISIIIHGLFEHLIFSLILLLLHFSLSLFILFLVLNSLIVNSLLLFSSSFLVFQFLLNSSVHFSGEFFVQFLLSLEFLHFLVMHVLGNAVVADQVVRIADQRVRYLVVLGLVGLLTAFERSFFLFSDSLRGISARSLHFVVASLASVHLREAFFAVVGLGPLRVSHRSPVGPSLSRNL